MYKGSFSVRWQGLSIVGTSVFYVISSSGVIQPSDDAGWSPSIRHTTKDEPYLWTKVVTTYNDGSTSSSYSVSRQGTDGNDGTNGTNFTPRGIALGHYSDLKDLLSAVSEKKVGDVYILDACSTGGSVNSSIPNPCVVTFMEAPDYDWYANAAEVGDAYNVDGRLWVNNGDEWADFGEVKGADGKDGEDGHNLMLFILKSTGTNNDGTKYIYDTDNNGELVGGGHTHFSYYGRFGDEIITDNTKGAEFSLEFPSDCNFNPHEAGLYEANQSTSGFFNTDGITRTNYTVNDEKMTAVCTSSYFLVCLSYKGFTVKQRIDFAINLSLFNGSVVETRYDWTAKYNSLKDTQTEQGKLIEKNESELKVQSDAISSKVSQTEYDADYQKVTESVSEVKQTANEISLSVDNLKDDLAATGIDITDKKVLVTADNFEIRNNSGKKTMSVDADGNLVTEGVAKIKGGINANYGYIGSFTIEHYSDSTGFDFYGLHSRTDGTSVIAPSSVLLDYQGLKVGTGYILLGGTFSVGNNVQKINNDEFCWSGGIANVEANFSASQYDVEQVAYNASAVGNAKNTVTCYKADAESGAINYAFYAKNGDVFAEYGNILANHFCGGIGLSVLNLSKYKEYYNSSELDLRQNGTWLVYTAANDGYNKLALPKLSAVKKLVNNASKFCVRLTIIAKTGSKIFKVLGRKTSDSNISSSEYPYYLDQNGNTAEGTSMAGGDILELMLVYDGTDYHSYCLNYRN